MEIKLMLLVLLTVVVVNGNPNYGSDHRENYYLTAMAYSGRWPGEHNNAGGEKWNNHGRQPAEQPVVVVEHIHKEEIDEDRYRIARAVKPSGNQPHQRYAYYPWQWQHHRSIDMNKNYYWNNPWLAHAPANHHFYAQRYGGSNWRETYSE
ncbi:hypothetical protein CHUAL_006929 [Chamberlinius hualienensis]